jgi:hypothetical protein|tara:strand:+ start:302 stop:550 length:249 start_codon:yes stop_codon:yes gene_type:complete
MTENTEVPVEEVPVDETAPAAQQQGADLSVQDLQALKTIIDVASSRGAFKPNEMVQIGQTYNKLDSFLAAVAAQQPQSPEGA